MSMVLPQGHLSSSDQCPVHTVVVVTCYQTDALLENCHVSETWLIIRDHVKEMPPSFGPLGRCDSAPDCHSQQGLISASPGHLSLLTRSGHFLFLTSTLVGDAIQLLLPTTFSLTPKLKCLPEQDDLLLACRKGRPWMSKARFSQTLGVQEECTKPRGGGG